MDNSPVRRPLKTRNTRWASACAQALTRIGLRPNHISLLSIFFAACAGACFLLLLNLNGTPSRIAALVGAAVCIQLRLLCNLLDGMVAVEGGFRTKSGEVYNDLPDRISDALILVPVGYIIAFPFGPELGWSAALMAVITAYVRVLAGACGAKQDFVGPMAKPHRMATLTVACLLASAEVAFELRPRILAIALVVIVVGSAWTVLRRTFRLLRELESK